MDGRQASATDWALTKTERGREEGDGERKKETLSFLV